MKFHPLFKVGILGLYAFPCSTKLILYPPGLNIQKRNLGSPVQCSALNLHNHPSLNPFQIILVRHSAISPKPLPFPRPLPGRQPPARCAARQRLLATACRRRPASAASSGVSDLDDDNVNCITADMTIASSQYCRCYHHTPFRWAAALY